MNSTTKESVVSIEINPKIKGWLIDLPETPDVRAVLSMYPATGTRYRSRALVLAEETTSDKKIAALQLRLAHAEAVLAEIGEYTGNGPSTTPWQQIVADIGKLARTSGEEHSHRCIACSHPYTPINGQLEDCPVCGAG